MEKHEGEAIGRNMRQNQEGRSRRAKQWEEAGWRSRRGK